MKPDNSPGFSSLRHVLAGNGLNYGFPATESSSFYAMETLELGDKNEARNFAASENHKEAERRRRDRINGHLDRLRTLLPCNSKTDKASLLAMVVERVRELKQQTSEIMQLEQMFPSEADKIAVLQNDDFLDGNSVIKATLCCEDRADLVPELIEILKPLCLSPLRAEMATMGGRIRNVMVLACDKDRTTEAASLLREGLKSLILRSDYVGGERSKRRRIFDQRIMG